MPVATRASTSVNATLPNKGLGVGLGCVEAWPRLRASERSDVAQQPGGHVGVGVGRLAEGVPPKGAKR